MEDVVFRRLLDSVSSSGDTLECRSDMRTSRARQLEQALTGILGFVTPCTCTETFNVLTMDASNQVLS